MERKQTLVWSRDTSKYMSAADKDASVSPTPLVCRIEELKNTVLSGFCIPGIIFVFFGQFQWSSCKIKTMDYNSQGLIQSQDTKACSGALCGNLFTKVGGSRIQAADFGDRLFLSII